MSIKPITPRKKLTRKRSNSFPGTNIQHIENRRILNLKNLKINKKIYNGHRPKIKKELFLKLSK